MTDEQLRAFWRGHGGRFHGPNVEMGTMPEADLLPLLRELLTTPERTLIVKPEEITFGGGVKAYQKKVQNAAQRLAGMLGELPSNERANPASAAGAKSGEPKANEG